MGSPVVLIYILAQPLMLIAAVAIFGWRYRKTVVDSMSRATPAIAASPHVTEHHQVAQAAVPLQIERLEEPSSNALGAAASQAMHRAHVLTRTANRCFLIAGSVFWATVVALQVCAVASRFPGRVLPLVALSAALPGLLVLLSVIARSWRAWAAGACIGSALFIAMIAVLGWQTGNFAKAGRTAFILADLYALVGLGVLLFIGRDLRSLLIGVIPVLLYVVAGVAIGLAVAAAWGWSGDLAELARRPGPRWPLSVLLAVGVAMAPASVWVFLRLLRSRAKWPLASLLAVVGIAGTALDEILSPSFPLGPLLAAVPIGVLQCLVVWLFFKGLVMLETAHWLPSQALHLHLCWSYLAIYSHLLLSAQLSHLSLQERSLGVGLFGAAFIAYFLLTHVLLRRAWVAGCHAAPKRLLLLRVFNAADKRERLLDALDDTWRRVGRVDLIGGSDLAMRTLRSLTLECFLLQRIDTEFLKAETDVEQRLARLRSRLESDLRYPVNEVYCYASAWQAAVLRLAPASDTVLLDLRGFTHGNAGCTFELTSVVWHVPLARVVLLADSTTDAKALEDIAQSAWASLPPDSPNAGAAAPRLAVVSISGAAEIAMVVAALFQTAFCESRRMLPPMSN